MALDEDYGDDFDEEQAEQPAPTVAPPAAPVAAPAAPAPAPMNPMVASHIQNLLSQKALADAQEQARTNHLYSGLSRAAGTLGHALSRAPAKMDESGFDALDKEADAPVQNILTQQKATAQDLANKGAATASEEAQKRADPNSVASYIARTAWINAHPELTESQKQDLKRASANDIGTSEKYDEIMQKTQATKQVHEDSLATRADARADKIDKQRDAAMSHTIDQLESARGSPAVAQAEKDIYAASKVQTLANLYGDPNNLNPQMVKMLVAEVGKIASGGQSSESELQYLTPSTLRGKLAGAWQALSNSPSPANAGAFIKQYQDYATQLSKDAQKVIEDKYGRVIDTRSDLIGDDNVNKLKGKYIDRFKNEAANRSPDGADPAQKQLVERKGADGRVGLFDPKTKQLVRYK